MFIPMEGDSIQIQSYKHNGKLHRIWEDTTVLKANQSTVIVANDRVRVTESDGRSWITREPAICYFHSQMWFNVIGMLREDGVYYYCNLSSPFVCDHEALKYIDYDLDIKVYPDMTFQLLDEDEYAKHSRDMKYPDVVDKILKKNVDQLKFWIRQQKGPFEADFVDSWYERFLTYR